MAKKAVVKKAATRKRAAAAPRAAATKPRLAVDNDSVAGIGHNSQPAKEVAIERLRGLVDRIERMEAERKIVGNDIRDIYAEAKSAGFNNKVLRQLIALRKREPTDLEEEETLLDLYKRSLGM